jgi:Holliday junction DNA helicase RuvA
MIYAVHGTVEHTEPYLAVIDTGGQRNAAPNLPAPGGVCYAVNTSLQTLSRLKKGESARLYTYLYLREGICDLYGFNSREELASFKLLIGISGVGPKAAVSILSASTPEKLALAVITGDEKALTVAPGIGKKLAQRVILELKDKLSKSGGEPPQTNSAAGGTWDGGSPILEAQAALCVLGYTPVEAAMAVKGLDESLPLEEMIRQALKGMRM